MSQNRLLGDAFTTAALTASAGTFDEGLVDDLLVVPADWQPGVHFLNLQGTIDGQNRPADGDKVSVIDPFGMLSPMAPLTIQGVDLGLGFPIADIAAPVDSITLTDAGSSRTFIFSNAVNCWTSTGKEINNGPVAGSEYSDFYAIMTSGDDPTDNPGMIAVGSAVEFPKDGPTAGGIVRSSTSQFTLTTAGTYEVVFQACVDEPAQLAVDLDGVIVPSTVVGRNATTDQIEGVSLLTATAGQVLRVVNPPGNASPLTISKNAGGNSPTSAHLVIRRVG